MGVNEGPRNRSLLLLATLRGSGVVWRPAVAQAWSGDPPRLILARRGLAARRRGSGVVWWPAVLSPS